MNKYFKLPFKADGSYIFDASNSMCFTDFKTYGKMLPRIVQKLNGKNVKFDHAFSLSKDDKTVILYNGNYCMDVRSWGRLTGMLGLKPKQAAEIQDEFVKQVINKLNE